MIAPLHSLLLLTALLTAVVQAEKPPLSYRYADTLRDALEKDPRPIVHLEDSVWDAERDDTFGLLYGPDDAMGGLGGVSLTATPPLLRDGEDLVISWSGVTRPHQTDFLGLSCGPKAHDKDFLVKVGITEARVLTARSCPALSASRRCT
jgi:hypothetical protein